MPVIVFPNAVPNPRAVVVEAVDAVVARAAVGRTGRPVEIARPAIFKRYLLSFDVDILSVRRVCRRHSRPWGRHRCFHFQRFRDDPGITQARPQQCGERHYAKVSRYQREHRVHVRPQPRRRHRQRCLDGGRGIRG